LRRFLAFSETAARAAGLTPQQHQALLAIKGAGSETVSVGDLADQLLLQPNSAAELVDRMVKCGLLMRAEAGDDRRRVVLSLTPSAEAALHALSAAHLRELRYSAPVLDGLLRSLKPDRARRDR
jgi:DNA-binding MarR family transcriptional regulator